MRPGQQNKRGRGRNNNNNGGGGNFNRKGVNPLTRTYDSSGPDVKIRGTAQHIAEKYGALARDAQSSGDRVMAENYLQHAEHYNRIIAAAQAQMQERFQREDRGGEASERDMDRDDDMDMIDDQPMAADPRQQQPRQHQQYQQPRPERVAPAQPIAGSGPQPVIDDIPVEVAAAVEEAGEAGEGGEKHSRRRNAQRPRRQPRRNDAGEGAAPAEASGGEAPAPATPAPAPASVAAEGEKKPAKRERAPRGGDDAPKLATAVSE